MGCKQPPMAWPRPTSQALSLITFSALPQFLSVLWMSKGLSTSGPCFHSLPLPAYWTHSLCPLRSLSICSIHSMPGWPKLSVDCIKSCGIHQVLWTPFIPLAFCWSTEGSRMLGAGDKCRWVSISQLHPSQILGACCSSWPSPKAGLSFSVL